MLVGNNLRSLEISEGKASEREDTYQTKLNELSEKFQQVIQLQPGCVLSFKFVDEIHLLDFHLSANKSFKRFLDSPLLSYVLLSSFCL